MPDRPLYIAKPHQVGDVVTLHPERGWREEDLGKSLVITKVPTRAREVNYLAVECDENGVAVPGATEFQGRPIDFVPFADLDIL